jgi:phosphotransferase system HPr (HPr) family protein
MPTTKEITVHHEVGLHARPAAQFVKLAANHQADIQVENLTKGTQSVNAKSLISVLSVNVTKDDRIRITAQGEDEQAAIEALTELIQRNFGEGEG